MPDSSFMIGFPHNGYTTAAFAMSLSRVASLSSGIIQYGGCNLIANRTRIIRKFLEHDASHLLMIDTDIEFTPDHVRDLYKLAHPNCSIVGAAIPLQDGSCVFYNKVAEGKYESIRPELTFRAYKLSAVGSGMICICRYVLEAMAKARADDPEPWFGRDIEGGVRLGSDITFCRRAYNAGFASYGAGWVRPKHHKIRPLVAAWEEA